MPISDNDIKSELSYAYLHAVAACAGCECHLSHRLSDNLGIDARLTAAGDFGPQPSLTVLDIYVQLKATSQNLLLAGNRFSFRIEKALYEKMRITTINNQWLLLLFMLPNAKAEWLKCSPRALTLKKCAYWVSLRDGPAAPDGLGDQLTIYIPKQNRFTVDALQKLLVRCASEDWVTYET